VRPPARLPLPPLPHTVVDGLELPRAWRRRGRWWIFEAQGRAPTAFSQIAPSIQVRPPPGAALRIQMAAEIGHGRWTDFLDVGWQANRSPVPTRRLRGRLAEVDVDYLKLAKPSRRWRLRLSARGGRPWTWPWGIASVTWRGGGRHRRWREVPPLDSPLRLSVPLASQMAEGGSKGPDACSPTCIQMMLAHRGIEAPVPRVMRETWDPAAQIYGNWQKAIEAAWRLGCPGVLVFLRHWGQVADCLRAGFPVAASIKFPRGKVTLPGAPIGHSGGHLVVIRGLTPEGKVLVNDPAADDRRGVARSYDLRAFSRAWFGFSGMGYLLLPPR
jgi:hypothetical protein